MEDKYNYVGHIFIILVCVFALFECYKAYNNLNVRETKVYDNTVEEYVQCEKLINPQISDSDATTKAERELEDFKGTDKMADKEKDLQETLLLLRGMKNQNQTQSSDKNTSESEKNTSNIALNESQKDILRSMLN